MKLLQQTAGAISEAAKTSNSKVNLRKKIKKHYQTNKEQEVAVCGCLLVIWKEEHAIKSPYNQFIKSFWMTERDIMENQKSFWS